MRNFKLTALALMFCMLVPGLVVAGDSLWAGADNTPNTKTGDVTYSFGQCYDGTAWDMIRCVAGVLSMAITSPLGSQAEATSVAVAPPTDAYFMISRDTLANAADNPIAVQLSQDGTNAVDATHPVPMSATMAANTLANPMFFQISADGTNAMDATHPLVISATAAANATANRIYVNGNIDQIVGTAANVNGGNRDAGTLTVTLADDDPGVASLGIIDDWDATHGSAVVADGPQVMWEAHSAQPAAAADGQAVRPAANVYGQPINAGYTWATNSNRTTETNPLDTRVVNTIPVNVTDYAETASPHTEYYYSANTGYRYNAWQLSLDSDNGTVTATIECTIEPDCAPAACTWFDVTADAFGVASLVSAAAPALDQWVDNDQKLAACTYTRVVVVYATGNANDDGDAWVSHAKWW